MSALRKSPIDFIFFCSFLLFSVLGDQESNKNLYTFKDIKFNNDKLRNYNNGGNEKNMQDAALLVVKSFYAMETYVLENWNWKAKYSDKRDISKHSQQFSTFNALEKIDKDGIDVFSTCINDTGRLISGFLDNENWAIPFFDATGKPGPSMTLGWLNFVGNYKQCKSADAKPVSFSDERRAGFRGGYFQLGLRPPSLPIPIKIDVCLPDTCSEQEVKSIGTEIFNASNISLSIDYVHCLTDSTEMTSSTLVAIVVLCVVSSLAFVGTAFDLVCVQIPVWRGGTKRTRVDCLRSQQEGSTRNGHQITITDNDSSPVNPSLTHKSPDKDQPNNVVAKIMLAFSVYSNGKKILTVSQAAGSLESIHGIRFLSMSWVVLGHIFFFARMYSINTISDFPELLNRWTFDVIANGFVAVDTFFALSGLLASYMTIGELLKKGIKLNWPMFYFHRYWRLTPPYMLTVVIYLGLQQYFVKGALRNEEQPVDKSSCERNWWTNLVYVNNLVHTDDQCFGHAWYLANDMQFFILSPLMMIPFYFHRLAGLCSCVVFLIASWITTGVSSDLEKWPTTGFTLAALQGGLGDMNFENHYYIKPWCRIGPFVVGILAGYVIVIHKERPLYMKRWIVALGWTIAALSSVAILYGLRGDISGNNTSSVRAAALYNTISRSVWGACVCWVIIACKTGYGGPVNTLLSWSPFVVLGRLTYMVYLIHIPVIFIFYENLDRPFYINDTTMAIYFLGILVFSNLTAFVFMLCLESPMVGLEKTFLKRERKC